jgi:hypothetical protein
MRKSHGLVKMLGRLYFDPADRDGHAKGKHQGDPWFRETKRIQPASSSSLDNPLRSPNGYS